MLYKLVNILMFFVLSEDKLKIETVNPLGNKIESIITIKNRKVKSFGTIYLPRSDQVYNKNIRFAHCNIIDTTFTQSTHYYKIILQSDCHPDTDDY